MGNGKFSVLNIILLIVAGALITLGILDYLAVFTWFTDISGFAYMYLILLIAGLALLVLVIIFMIKGKKTVATAVQSMRCPDGKTLVNGKCR